MTSAGHTAGTTQKVIVLDGAFMVLESENPTEPVRRVNRSSLRVSPAKIQ